MMNKTVFLFDIDGVLVEPNGYREAVQASMRYFLRQMGLDERLASDADVYARYEAVRITSEWDMVPLNLAAVLDALVAANPDLHLPQTVEDLGEIRPAAGRLAVPPVDYRTPIELLGAAIQVGEYPADVALRLAQTPGSDLFPRIGAAPLLRQLLSHTRDVYRSPTTRLFQHFSLGSQAFRQTYGLDPVVETGSLLSLRDTPLASPDLIQRLLARQQNGLALAAYTLRPSLPPREVDGDLRGYAPEAELALQLVGLSELPLIGYGRIQFLAQQKGIESDVLLKPSPVQALAAVFAALTRQEAVALEWADAWIRRWAPEWMPAPLEPAPLAPAPRAGDAGLGPVVELLGSFSGLDIHVFEDSAGGIEAVRRAGKILEAGGAQVNVHAWGITAHPEKEDALRRIGVGVYPNVKSALLKAFGEA